MEKRKNLAVVCLTAAFLLGFLIWGLCKPDDAVSVSERRKLAQKPELTLSSVLRGEFMTKFETYTLDQFPLRDSFRALKAFFSGDILRQLDNNGVYAAGGHLAKLDYPVNTDLVRHAAERFSTVYETYFANAGANVYYSVVPDKNYFLAEQNGYPAMDYELLTDTMRAGMTFAEYIDIFDTLSLDMYYRTDTHWRQECLLPAAQTLCQAVDVSSAFRGVYAGQYALPVEPDALRYLTNGTIAALRVYDYETGAEIPVYDLTLAAGRDGYEMFLGGTKALLTIENPNAETDRELVIFRDSFGSSIAPLLAQGYAKVTVVDIRYMAPALAGRFVDLSQADDVLFLYSTGVLNHSETIQ